MASDIKTVERLETAFKTEIAGYRFYSEAAATVADEKGRNIFAHLAKEELEHIKVVHGISETARSGKAWVAFDDAIRVGGTLDSGSLPIYPGQDALVERLKKNQTDLNALRIGMEIEEAATEFYSMMLKDATTPGEKVILTKLLEMEKGHLKILRWESESLMRTGFWAGQIEYSVEKELD
ncbi:MAG: ferritin family protein [Deltaproteobacteria bacterium]|nr:ferritin family protein [Deltaproteobacteria bacterium]